MALYVLINDQVVSSRACRGRHYAATKAFVLFFTEALAEELRDTGVRVMGAHPGATDTGFFDHTTAVMDPRVTDRPEVVAAQTLDDFARGKAASYPGRRLHRVSSWAPRFLPRTAVTRTVAAMNRKLGTTRSRTPAPRRGDPLRVLTEAEALSRRTRSRSSSRIRAFARPRGRSGGSRQPCPGRGLRTVRAASSS